MFYDPTDEWSEMAREIAKDYFDDYEKMPLEDLKKVVEKYSNRLKEEEKVVVTKKGFSLLLHKIYRIFNPVIESYETTDFNTSRLTLAKRTKKNEPLEFKLRDIQSLGFML